MNVQVRHSLAFGFAICAGVAIRHNEFKWASTLMLWSVLLGGELFWLMHSWARIFLSIHSS